MSTDTSITFYDIASREPRRTFAPNPWKVRLALNIKGVPYRTEWVEMPDIASVREKLGVPANRSLPSGEPYHTLPVVKDNSTGKVIGDSFEIALYLDSTYPDGPSLFRTDATGLTAAFNVQIDGIFTKFAGLCATSMPFDPKQLGRIQAMFAARMSGIKSQNVAKTDESREEQFVSFEAALGELAKAYRHTGGTTDYFWRAGGTEQAQAQRGREAAGPFLDGDSPAYSDCILTGWLKMFEACLPDEEWQRIRSWHSGLWGSVVDAMSKWGEIK